MASVEKDCCKDANYKYGCDSQNPGRQRPLCGRRLQDWDFLANDFRQGVGWLLIFPTVHPFHRDQKAITDLGHGLNELGVLDGTSQGPPQLLNRCVDSVLEVHKGIVWPQGGTQ